MEPFVFVHAPENKKSLNSQSVKKHELPKHHTSQNPTFQIYSIEKDVKRETWIIRGYFFVLASY